MFVFGHLGFGRLLAQPIKNSVRITPLLFGAVLSDLIDKPLFILFPEWFRGSRGPAHTLLFLLLIVIFARVRHSRVLLSIAVGVLTHLVLDNVGDLLAVHQYGLAANCQTLFWPLRGFDFPYAPHLSLHEQAKHLSQPYFIATESLGVLLLVLFFFKDRAKERVKARKPKAV